MTTLVSTTDTVTRDALAVLQPGFTGTSAPDWLLRRVGEGLASVGLFGRNIQSPEQLAALTARLRAERDDVLVAIDEEGGDVTRLDASSGSRYPGNHALGAVDDVELTRHVGAAIGAELAAVGLLGAILGLLVAGTVSAPVGPFTVVGAHDAGAGEGAEAPADR